jgi:uncharacterized protein
MTIPPPPRTAAWCHRGSRSGFEVLFAQRHGTGFELIGTTTATEAEEVWIVDHDIVVDDRWATRRARISARTSRGFRQVLLLADGRGNWTVDGRPAPFLEGCLDVDLESSAMTNTLPVHRLSLDPEETTSTPAAYVRALDLTVERLEQSYTQLPDRSGDMRFRYAAPAFDFACDLTFDRAGLVVDYPGIAVRAS